MIEIRIYNDRSGEILRKPFTDSADADEFEFYLDFLDAHYARYENGELIYELNA